MTSTPDAAEPALDAATLWLLGLCAFASMASMRICDAMLPALASEFRVTLGQAAQAISALALAYGVMQLVYGPLGDRYGKARVVGLATLGCTLGTLGAALSPSLEWLVASRALTGMAAAAIIPLTMAWIGDSVGYDRRQEVLARLLGATVMGMICGQWLGGWMAGRLGWRWAFVWLAALFALGGLLLMRQARHRTRQPLSPASMAGPSSAGPRVLQVLSTRWARTVLAVACIEGAFAFSALAFIPLHLHAGLGLSMPAAGGVVALYGVGGLIYSRSAARLLGRVGEPGLARLGGICAGMGLITVAAAPTWPWALPACLLAGFGFYALHNTLQTHATQMTPSARGTAVSLFSCVLFFGQSIGVWLAAWTVDRASAAIVLAVSAVGLALLAGLFAALLAKAPSARPARSPAPTSTNPSS